MGIYLCSNIHQNHVLTAKAPILLQKAGVEPKIELGIGPLEGSGFGGLGFRVKGFSV